MAAPMVWQGFSQGTRQGQPDDPGIYPDYNADLFALGPWPTTAAPWLDVMEDPNAPGLPLDLVAEPQLPRPDVGAEPIVGAYQAWEAGPVQGWSQEEQNSGKIMRFSTNPVLRVDEFGAGVMDGPSYADELAASIANNGAGQVTDSQVTTDLILYR
jgi:hypothetical protein